MDAPVPLLTRERFSSPRLACPRDATQLIVEAKGGIKFLSCPRCLGWWLPSIAAQALVGRIPSTLKTKSPSIQCPNDRLLLSVVKYRTVEIDLCESCGGVWLDAGEWQKIARRTAPKEKFKGAVDLGGDFLVEVGGEFVGFVVRCVFEAISGL